MKDLSDKIKGSSKALILIAGMAAMSSCYKANYSKVERHEVVSVERGEIDDMGFGVSGDSYLITFDDNKSVSHVYDIDRCEPSLKIIGDIPADVRAKFSEPIPKEGPCVNVIRDVPNGGENYAVVLNMGYYKTNESWIVYAHQFVELHLTKDTKIKPYVNPYEKK